MEFWAFLTKSLNLDYEFWLSATSLESNNIRNLAGLFRRFGLDKIGAAMQLAYNQ